MYALISVYDDTNKCIYKNSLLTPNMVNHDGEYTTYKFEFSITVAENQVSTMNGKFKHDDIPEPEASKCMICGRVIYDDKAICDKCYEIAKKEGLLV